MAPLDRQQRRLERQRGAGYSAASANLPKPSFAFSLPGQATKQASLPPQRSGRRSRTPISNTPRGANGSAQRARSASAQRSSAKKQRTPGQITPQLGKRKRGQKHAQSGDEDDGELDQLSPDNDVNGRSVETSRKVAGPVSPIREDPDEMDELSVLGDETGSARKVGKAGSEEAHQATPVPETAQALFQPKRALERTPVLSGNSQLVLVSRSRPLRYSKSKSLTPAPAPAPAPITPIPGIVARRNVDRSMSGSQSGRQLNIPIPIEDEDELLTPKASTATPVSSSRSQSLSLSLEEQEAMGMDELSPSVPSSNDRIEPESRAQLSKQAAQEDVQPLAGQPTHEASHGQKRRRIAEEEDQIPAQTTPTINKPRRTRRRTPPEAEPEIEQDPVQTTPAIEKPRRTRDRTPEVVLSVDEDQQQDEASFERERSKSPSVRPVQQSGDALNFSGRSPDRPAQLNSSAMDFAANPTPSDREESEEEGQEEAEEEEEDPQEPTPRPAISKRPQSYPSPNRKRPASDMPPKKRQKHDGPKQLINVMRIKGEKIKGFTVADTTRTAMEDYIDSRVNQLSARYQGTQDLDRRKQIKTRINLQLSFKEALTERMMDLQDVNDSLTIRTQKLKAFKKVNAELRKEILAAQEGRQEMALEMDDVLAEFEMEKKEYETNKKLSADMFDIQAAIKRGREKAIELNREGEGPDVPLSMLLENVARGVGSVGGGLLYEVQTFNGMLEKAARFLEGRV
ncbi:hypothetical protein K504DRAFT_440658 [Pleomassaria siparia CBS 279.74]|uniref:Inner kinetochore subunit AME1 domain-containing protein n=1 Tax=Pleomassaria siparia CBS 279.74 TaxID=1314801 RepID=A0A6G1JWC0_9PLEO|nr:hypothetical protein K504DRAFT_440658 [Pleomassaria siparia CBS 279.74]